MPDPSPSTNPAPRPCPPQLDKGQELLDKQLPVYDGGFWALLILVTSAVLIPLSVARRAQRRRRCAVQGAGGRARACVGAPHRPTSERTSRQGPPWLAPHLRPSPLLHPRGAVNALITISMIMLGVCVSFGFMAQTLTLRLFWREVGGQAGGRARRARAGPRRGLPTAPLRAHLACAGPAVLTPSQVVLGMVYAALAAAASSLVAGCPVCVRSAHDEVRASSAELLLLVGASISK